MSSTPAATVRCPPISDVTRAATVEASTTNRAIGTNASPALVGENPRIPWR